jgi:hypothetical protein
LKDDEVTERVFNRSEGRARAGMYFIWYKHSDARSNRSTNNEESQSLSNSLLLSGKINLFGFAPFDVAHLARDPMWSFNF